jgi:hypothetical protein
MWWRKTDSLHNNNKSSMLTLSKKKTKSSMLTVGNKTEWQMKEKTRIINSETNLNSNKTKYNVKF